MDLDDFVTAVDSDIPAPSRDNLCMDSHTVVDRCKAQKGYCNGHTIWILYCGNSGKGIATLYATNI